MAGTRVRYGWEYFAQTALELQPLADAKSAMIQAAPAPELYLIAFICVQTAQFALLLQSGRLDLSLALCLSAALIIGAGLLARQQSEPNQVPGESVACPSAAVSEIRTIVECAGPIDRTAPVNIDEQSQTWADLMARISHEIRTPLNAVIGFADLMEREIFGPLGNPRYRDYAAHIKDSGEALLKSAEDTLALSAMLATPAPGLRPQCSHLATLTRDAWLAVEPHASRHGVTLEVHMADALDVAGDRRAFRQALSNLLMEAAKRAKAHSCIDVTARAEGDTVWIKVAAANVERPRASAAPSLGICVARALLELHGTSLVTADKPGQLGWQATTVLDLAVQADFFATAPGHTPAVAL